MRHLVAIILCVLPLISSIAQSSRADVAIAKVNSVVADKNTGGEPDKKLRANPAQARKKIVGLFNLFKDFEVIVDTAAMRSSFTDFMKDDLTTPTAITQTEMSATDFSQYLANSEKLLIKKLEKLEKDKQTNGAYWEEKSRVQRAMSILQSAYCLAGKERTGSFVFSKDADGYDIICFPLDSLRSNSRYGTIDNYKEGFARIRKDQVYGYLNYCGDEFVTCQYQTADAFNYGRALVKKVDWYFLDVKGEESATLENVTYAKSLVRGVSLAKFTNGKYALIDNTYDVSQTPISEYFDAIEPFYRKEIFRVRNGKKIGLLNLDGTLKLDINYDKIDPSTKLPNVYTLTLGETIGLLDSLGNVKFKPIYTSISDFNKFGLANAYTKEGTVQLINGKSMTASALYQSIGGFNKFGLTAVKNAEGKIGLLDSVMNVVLAPTYTTINDYNNYGLAAVAKNNLTWGFINTKGVEVIVSKYGEVGQFNNYGLVVVREPIANCVKGECLNDGVLDYKGNVVIPFAQLTEEATKTRYFVTDTILSEKYIALIQKNGNQEGYRLIEKNIFKQINKTSYEAITPHDQYGMFAFRDHNHMWGLMDTTGRVWAKPIYKEIRKSREDYYPALNDKGKWGYIDKKGKPQIPFEYEEVKSFRLGYSVVSQGKDKWGLINKFNAKVVPCSFRTLNPVAGSDKYEIFDNKENAFIINAQGECEKNCEVFEAIRRAANTIETTTNK